MNKIPVHTRRKAWLSRFNLPLLAGLVAMLLSVGAGCGGEVPSTDFVARVGNRILTREDVSRAIETIGPSLDSVEAARRYVDQWITDELLAREAGRRGLRDEPSLRKLIEESERSVVVSALIERVYAESAGGPSDELVQEYFDSHRDRLRLIEPYVKVRHLIVDDEAKARAAQVRLAAADTSAWDEWDRIVEEFAASPELAREGSDAFTPESQFLLDLPAVRDAVAGLRPGRTTPVLESDGLWHVAQLVERVPAGTVPRLAWIRESLRQRVEIEARKQMYTRLVQDLRNEALARQDLVIR